MAACYDRPPYPLSIDDYISSIAISYAYRQSSNVTGARINHTHQINVAGRTVQSAKVRTPVEKDNEFDHCKTTTDY